MQCAWRGRICGHESALHGCTCVCTVSTGVVLRGFFTANLQKTTEHSCEHVQPCFSTLEPYHVGVGAGGPDVHCSGRTVAGLPDQLPFALRHQRLHDRRRHSHRCFAGGRLSSSTLKSREIIHASDSCAVLPHPATSTAAGSCTRVVVSPSAAKHQIQHIITCTATRTVHFGF